MFAQFVVSLVTIGIIAWLLWWGFRKRVKQQFAEADPEDDNDSEDMLRWKMKELEKKKELAEALRKEVHVTDELNEIDKELEKVRTLLKRKEQRREQV